MKKTSLYLMTFVVLMMTSCAKTATQEPVIPAKAVSVRTAPPLVLKLQATEQNDLTLLDVHMELKGNLPTAPEIKFKTGTNTVMGDGRPLPVLQGPTLPGRQTKRLALKKLVEPVTAFVEYESPSFGFYVEATWPPKPEAPVVQPNEAEIPPTQIRGIEIDKAINLD